MAIRPGRSSPAILSSRARIALLAGHAIGTEATVIAFQSSKSRGARLSRYADAAILAGRARQSGLSGRADFLDARAREAFLSGRASVSNFARDAREAVQAGQSVLALIRFRQF